MDDMTPNERLRESLNERGIKYDVVDNDLNHRTFWDLNGIRYEYSSYDKSECGCLSISCANFITPEQAIAATVDGSDVSAMQAKVRAQSDYINKLRGEYKALDEQMERRCAEYRSEIHKLRAKLDAATVGNGTDLSKRLREVHGLHAFAELFGFDWTDGSDWSWHDVACAMADAIDAANTEPDEATMLKLHDRMNAALLDYESAMGIEGGNGAKTVPFVIEMHQIIEDAAKAGARIREETE